MATSLPAGAVGGDRNEVLNLPNLHSQAGKFSESCLGPWFRVLVLFLPVAQSLMWRTLIRSFLHLWAISWAANMAVYGKNSSLSAFILILPVTWQMVSLPERSVAWMRVSPKDAKMRQMPNMFYPSAT